MVKNKISLRLFLSIIICLMMVLSISVAASKQRIYDLANLLTKDEIGELEKVSDRYSAKRETDFIILTIDDPKGKDIVEYAQDFYDEKGLGYDKNHGNTVILTIDMKNRELYLSGFKKGEKYLDDYRLDIIRDKISPDLSRGNYYDAFYSFIKTSHKFMGIRPGVNPNNIIFNLWFQILASLGIAGVVVGIMAYNTGGRTTVNASTYQDPINSKIIARRDNYLRTSVSKRRKPSDNNSGKGGGRMGGGGGGVTKAGHSHSGSRGKF